MTMTMTKTQTKTNTKTKTITKTNTVWLLWKVSSHLRKINDMPLILAETIILKILVGLREVD